MLINYLLPIIATLFLSAYVSSLNAQTIPPLVKIGIINSDKVLYEIGKSDLPKINKYLIDVANANQIQIIFGSAAYIDSSENMTEAFIQGYKSGAPASSLTFSNLKTNPGVAVVNREKVFGESKLGLAMASVLQAEFTGRQNDLRAEAQALKNSALQFDAQANSLSEREKQTRMEKMSEVDRVLQGKQRIFTQDLNLRTLEERTKIAKEANIVTAQLANKLGLSVIFQEAAYVSPEFDVTGDVIALLNKDKKIEQISTRPVFSKPAKVAIVMSEQLYAELGDSVSMSNEERLKIRTELATKVNPILAQFAKSNNINIVLQRPNYADSNVDITASLIALMKNPNSVFINTPKDTQTPIADAKQKCLDLGFKDKTEAFGKCVLRLSK